MSSHGGSTQNTSQVQARCPSTEKGKGTCYPQPRSYFQLILTGKEKDRFSSKECPWVFQSHSRVSPMPKSSRLTQNRLHSFLCVDFLLCFGNFFCFDFCFSISLCPPSSLHVCECACFESKREHRIG